MNIDKKDCHNCCVGLPCKIHELIDLHAELTSLRKKIKRMEKVVEAAIKWNPTVRDAPLAHLIPEAIALVNAVADYKDSAQEKKP